MLQKRDDEQSRVGREAIRYLPLVEAPPEIWASVEAAFEKRRSRAPAVLRWRWSFCAIAVLAVIGAAYWRFVPRSAARWEVVRLDGSPVVGTKPIRERAAVGAGQWIETDSRSRATVQVGGIGSVEIEPGTRLRVVTAQAGEHRLALAEGEIRARISAPPRLFFVDTAAGTAVDLGCEYALSSADNGSGVLHVTRGWVSFEWRGIESLVPAGASCQTFAHRGPSIPYFADAPAALQKAVRNFGLDKTGDQGVEIILNAARVRDTLTLWHLLRRVEGRDRERVYERIAALTPVPAGVSRELALKLDAPTLTRWKDALAWTW